MKHVEMGETEVLIANVDDAFYAIDLLLNGIFSAIATLLDGFTYDNIAPEFPFIFPIPFNPLLIISIFSKTRENRAKNGN